MTKEELLEMVNATISGNGKQEITGKSLNLALTEIINAMGTSGGSSGLIVYIIPEDGMNNFVSEDGIVTIPGDVPEEVGNYMQECIFNNIKVYNAFIEHNSLTPIPGPIYWDASFASQPSGGIFLYWSVSDSIITLQTSDNTYELTSRGLLRTQELT